MFTRPHDALCNIIFVGCLQDNFCCIFSCSQTLCDKPCASAETELSCSNSQVNFPFLDVEVRIFEHLWLLSLEKRRFRGVLDPSPQFPDKRVQPGGDWAQFPGNRERRRWYGHRLHQGRFRSNIGKKILHGKAVGHWEGLPGEVVESSSMEVLKLLFELLNTQLKAGFDDLGGLSNLNDSVRKPQGTQQVKPSLCTQGVKAFG